MAQGATDIQEYSYMLRKRFLISLTLSCLANSVFAQKENIKDRSLSGVDSIEIRNTFFSGLREKTSGRIDEAERSFKRTVELDSLNGAALYELSNIYRIKQQIGLAEQYAVKAVAANPDNKWFLLLLTDIYKQTQKLDQLPEVYDRLTKLEPGADEYLHDKANALILLGRTKEAEPIYTEIESTFGPSPRLETLKQRLLINDPDPDRGISVLEELIKKNPADIRNYLALTELYLKTGLKEKALNRLKEANKIEPKNPYVILLMADVYRSEGKDAEAFKELKKVVADDMLDFDVKAQIIFSYFPKIKNPVSLSEATELALLATRRHPKESRAFAIYGDLLAQSKDLKGAREAYKQALSISEKEIRIWEQLLEIEMSMGEFEKVLEDGEQALTLFKDRSSLYFFTGIAYAQLENHEKAIERFSQATSLDTENAVYQSQVQASLGNSLNSLKKYKEADAAFDKALTLDPVNAYALNNYAYYLSLRKEHLEKAAKMSSQANELDPENASFQDTYAWVLFQQKKYADARIWIEKAIKNNAGSGIQFEHFGDILFHLKETDLALENWTKARTLGVKSEILDKKINEKKYFE
ncbi:tetratricopeptide repeat protein [Arcticibacter pallidicorallinus]|uniref:Tetratricopeptide repeat protein n=2 Tax=Arcticibacter pallidicorallinus TaxID=1259464 RepID=A0A2T0U6U4_9SPHI|nr:tetratricopeptide repeat protein [Arcticibacter pallidicorallinus]